MDERALQYDGFDPGEEGLREALTSTGNGYFCTRGTAEWEDTDDVHYAGTYAHGLYNRETTIMGGRPVLNEDLVNLPNWLVLKLRVEGEDAIRMSNVELLEYRHEYDIGVAMVSRELRFRDRGGRETTLRSRRFMSMAHSHQAAIEWTLTAENWSGCVEVVTALDGRVTNGGVARYGDLEGRHLDAVSPRTFGPEIIAPARRDAPVEHLRRPGRPHPRVPCRRAARGRARSLFQAEDYIQQVLSFDVSQGEPVRVEKLVSLYTSRDRAIYEPLTNAGKSVGRYPDFAEALQRHTRAWDELWRSSDVVLPGNERVQHLLRLHISHILQVCSLHTTNHDAGVPARGLNGEAYRGHVFWDELYVFRYLTSRLPEITRELIMYRYRRLGEARAAAREAGYRGAMFPWQSGSDGSEETQVVHLNPLSGQWDPDLSHRQRHVNAAIFYNVWHYHQATGDLDFLRDHGAEIMLEIARFWSSIAHYNAERDRYEIHGVMGPDEFHEKYPGAERERAAQQRLHEHPGRLDLRAGAGRPRPADRAPARHAAREARPHRRGDRDSGSEMSREDVRAVSRRRDHQPVRGLRRARGARLGRATAPSTTTSSASTGSCAPRATRPTATSSPSRPTRCCCSSSSRPTRSRGCSSVSATSGAPTARARNIDYYDARTSHGSTLSYIAHAGVLAPIDPEHSWERFLVALESDIGDVQGGTTKEGIHLGVMAGTIDLVQRAYTGAEIRDGVLCFAPVLADKLNGLSFPMQVHGTPIRVTVGDGELTVVITGGFSRALKVGIGDDIRELGAGERCTFTLDPPTAPAAVGQGSDTQGGT